MIIRLFIITSLFLNIFDVLSQKAIPYNGIVLEFLKPTANLSFIDTSIENKYRIDDIVIAPDSSYCFFKLIPEFSEIEFLNIKEKLKSHENTKFIGGLRVLNSGSFSGETSLFYLKSKYAIQNETLNELQKRFQIMSIHKNKYSEKIFELEVSINTNIEELKQFVFYNSDTYEYISQNYFYSVLECVNDTFFSRQWALKNDGTPFQGNGTPGADMNVDSAWTITTGSPSIKIAILDSGTDTLHPDLINNLLPGFDATGQNSNGYPNLTYSSDGHGTCTAGIVAAEGNNNIGTAGVAYTSKIIPVRIFYYVNFLGQIVPFSSTQMGTDGLNWATFNAKADVLSNSWGIRNDEIPLLGIDTVYSNDVLQNIIINGRNGLGIPALFSSGNDGDTFCIWPSSLPLTIAVGATSMCDEHKTSFDCSPENWTSNYDKGLDVSAPGVRIVTSDISGAKGYTPFDHFFIFNGTSASCPHVAGVMGLMYSVNSDMTADMARQILSETCDKTGGYLYDSTAQYGTWSKELGYGRVNAYKAVQQSLQKVNIQHLKNEELSAYVYRNNSTFEQFLVLENKGAPKKVSVKIYDVLAKEYFSRQEIIYHKVSIPIHSLNFKGLGIANIILDENNTSIKFIK